jgi:hypothetical protein
MIEGPEADTPLTPQPRGPEPRGTKATHGLLRADGRLGPPHILPIRSSSVFQSEKASCPFKSGVVVSATPSYFSISTLGMQLPFVSLFGLMACCPFRFSKKNLTHAQDDFIRSLPRNMSAWNITYSLRSRIDDVM